MSKPSYMLDTDTLSYIIKGKPASTRLRFVEIEPSQVAISSIVRHEIQFGLKKLPRFHSLHRRTETFLAHITVLAWDADAADLGAEIRYRMRIQGTPLPEMDIMIAAHAMSLNATLVTNNLRHFRRFQPDLRLENWVTEGAG
jgi:tRNA(fMet)-specific endonuclease VapC